MVPLLECAHGADSLPAAWAVPLTCVLLAEVVPPAQGDEQASARACAAARIDVLRHPRTCIVSRLPKSTLTRSVGLWLWQAAQLRLVLLPGNSRRISGSASSGEDCAPPGFRLRHVLVPCAAGANGEGRAALALVLAMLEGR